MATPKWNKQKKLWIIQGQKNGVKKSFYSSMPGREGKKEVLEKYEDWIEFGGIHSVTVEKCVALYLKDIEARLGKKDTWTRVESYARLYVLPALGKAKMNNLTLRDWQAVLNEARPQKRGLASLSHKTLGNLREVLTGLHRFAYVNYYCDEWRGSLYIPQGHQKGEREILQPGEIARLFEPSSDWFAGAFRVMLLCGLRPGECLGIRKEDVHGSVLFVSRSVNTHGIVTEGKNKNAKRAIPLPPMALEIINETIERNQKANFGTPWVFCGFYGDLATQGTVRKHWKRFKAERGLPGTLYSLRHTFVSIVSSQTHLAEGTIKELVGHSKSMDTFGTYKHAVRGELESAADVINLTFERLKAEGNT